MKVLPLTSTTCNENEIEIEIIEEWINTVTFSNEIQYSAGKYCIVWFQSGTGIFYEGTTVSLIKKNLIICLSNVQQKIIVNADATGFVLCFNKRLLETSDMEFDLNCQYTLFNRLSKTAGLPIDQTLEADLLEVAFKMKREIANSWTFKNDMLKKYLKIFFVILFRHFENEICSVSPKKKVRHVDRFIDLLEHNFRTKKMVSDYANTLYVSANYLNEVVKNTTGYSASHHIRQRIIAEAKKMAFSSDNNMKEIAYSLGFADCAHFSKFFKTVAGNNFSDYKKQRLAIDFMA